MICLLLSSKALPCLALPVSAWPSHYWTYIPMPSLAYNFWAFSHLPLHLLSPHGFSHANVSLDSLVYKARQRVVGKAKQIKEDLGKARQGRHKQASKARVGLGKLGKVPKARQGQVTRSGFPWEVKDRVAICVGQMFRSHGDEQSSKTFLSWPLLCKSHCWT